MILTGFIAIWTLQFPPCLALVFPYPRQIVLKRRRSQNDWCQQIRVHRPWKTLPRSADISIRSLVDHPFTIEAKMMRFILEPAIDRSKFGSLSFSGNRPDQRWSRTRPLSKSQPPFQRIRDRSKRCLTRITMYLWYINDFFCTYVIVTILFSVNNTSLGVENKMFIIATVLCTKQR